METSRLSQHTHFPHDVLVRFTCIGLDDATGCTPEGRNHGDPPDFDFVIIGGGPFGSAIPQQLFANDCTQRHHVKSMKSRTRR